MNLHVLIFIVSLFVVVTVALHLNNGDGLGAPIVHTDNGQILGTIERTLLDYREYYAFRGIPYGKAPIDALRFKAPVRAAPWTGVRNGSNFGSPCAQPTMYMNDSYGHEDCLTLNVFSSGKQIVYGSKCINSIWWCWRTDLPSPFICARCVLIRTGQLHPKPYYSTIIHFHFASIIFL